MITPGGRRRQVLPWVADLACVVGFALGGRSTHEPEAALWVLLSIAWPFALAVTVAHAGMLLGGRETGRVWPGGLLVLVSTYTLAMMLRWASGRGLATGFLVVAALFLAVTMLGWRTALDRVRRRG